MSEIPLVALDANAFDGAIAGRDEVARIVRRLIDEDRLRLVVPGGIAAEVSHPHAPPELRSLLATARAVTRSRPTGRQEIDRIRVRAILRGDGRPGKHDADAAHLSDAAEAGCRFFVTADGKILRKREVLGTALPEALRIVTWAELVAAFTDRDQQRRPG